MLYIVKEGTVKVHDIGFGDSQYVDQIMGAGDFFGERVLLTGEPRPANITATTDSVMLCLSREMFEKSMGPLQDLIDHAMKKRVLMGVPIFANSQFQPYEMARLTDLVAEVTFHPGEVLAEEGQPAKQNLYIIRDGKVVVTNANGMISNLGPGDYFGEQMLQGQEGVLSEQTITSETRTACGVLTKSAIDIVIGQISRLGQSMPPAAPKLDTTIDFRDLVKFRILEVGTCGKVWLVSHQKTGVPYALNMLNKREIIGHHQVEGVIREKNIMTSIYHPFVFNLICTFQDDRHLSSPRPGTDPERQLALLRRLHPGTPEYLAPDIILSKGHDKGVDYWAFGVLIYEVLVGRSPFYSYGTDQVSLFKRIVQVKYSFPPGGAVNDIAQDLIQRLIVRRQSNRFGCLARADMDIRDHAWFGVITTEKLLQKKIPAPWIPQLKDPLDASHFDSYKHMENEAPSNKPGLSSGQQDLFQDF
ncbi:hypothetical protein ACHAWF_010336 [Thalassiosira exigua]